MVTQAELQQLGSAQAVFEYARNNGLSLDQLAQIGGVSTADMAGLATANGIDPKQLSQIGYTAPAPAPAPVAAPAPTKEYLSQLATQKGGNAVFDYALANNLTMADLARIGGVTESEMRRLASESDAFKGESMADAARVFGGQMVRHDGGGSPTWVYEGPQGTSAIQDLSILTGGRLKPGTAILNDPYTDAYSGGFARNNTNGGGFDFVNQMGGPDGFRKWVDAQPGGLRAYRASLGYQDAAGMIPGDAGYSDNGAGYTSHWNLNSASGNQPGRSKQPTYSNPSSSVYYPQGGANNVASVVNPVQRQAPTPVAAQPLAPTQPLATPVAQQPLVPTASTASASTAPKRRSLGTWTGFVNPQTPNTQTTVEG